MKRILPLLTLIVSCSTTKFIAPELEIIYTKKGKNSGGTVVYNPNGIEKIVSARRQEAVDRMLGVCYPSPYKITKEETLPPEKRNPKYSGNMKIFAGSTVRFIDFDCVNPYN